MSLAQVSRYWREAVDSEVTKLAPTCLSEDITEDIVWRFPQLHTLDLIYCSQQSWPWFPGFGLFFLTNLQELLNWDVQSVTDASNDFPAERDYALRRVTKLTISNLHCDSFCYSFINWPELRDLRVLSAESPNCLPLCLYTLEEVTYLDLSGMHYLRG